MNKKLCVCLIERDLHRCMDFVTKTNADIIEHRLDFMDHIGNLNQIYAASVAPIIATCRSQNSGGRFQGEEEDRINYLLEAVEAGASYVDIELEMGSKHLEQILQVAMNNECKCIVSKHYFDSTPDAQELLALLNQMANGPADIMKIVTTPSSIEDCIRTLLLYEMNETELPLIAFGMGQFGRFTRIRALKLGAPFMYVSQDIGRVAAPGQISLSQMRKLMEVIL